MRFFSQMNTSLFRSTGTSAFASKPAPLAPPSTMYRNSTSRIPPKTRFMKEAKVSKIIYDEKQPSLDPNFFSYVSQVDKDYKPSKFVAKEHTEEELFLLVKDFPATAERLNIVFQEMELTENKDQLRLIISFFDRYIKKKMTDFSPDRKSALSPSTGMNLLHRVLDTCRMLHQYEYQFQLIDLWVNKLSYPFIGKLVTQILLLKYEFANYDMYSHVITFDLDEFIDSTVIFFALKKATEAKNSTVVDALIGHMNADNMSVNLFNILIDYYIQLGQVTNAKAFVKIMKNHQLIPNATTWKCLILGLLAHGQYAQAKECFDNMILSKESPTSMDYVLARLLTFAKQVLVDWSEVVDIVEKIEASKVAIGSKVIIFMMHCYLEKNCSVQYREKLLSILLRFDPEGKYISFVGIASSLISQERYQEVEQLLYQVNVDSIPKIKVLILYSKMIKALSKSNNLRDVYEVMRRNLRHAKVSVDAKFISSCLEAFLAAQDESLFRELELELWNASNNIIVTDVLLRQIVIGFCKWHDYDTALERFIHYQKLNTIESTQSEQIIGIILVALAQHDISKERKMDVLQKLCGYLKEQQFMNVKNLMHILETCIDQAVGQEYFLQQFSKR